MTDDKLVEALASVAADAYRAGSEDTLIDWKEVCECAPLPRHAGIEEGWQNHRPQFLSRLREHTPKANSTALLGDEDGLRELRLLFNHSEDDSRQFTRWAMVTAINHGIRLAHLSATPADAEGLITQGEGDKR